MVDLWPTFSAIIVAVVLAAGAAAVRVLPSQRRRERDVKALAELAAVAPPGRSRDRLELLIAIKVDDYSRRAVVGMSFLPIGVTGIVFATLTMASFVVVGFFDGTAQPEEFDWWRDFVIVPAVTLVLTVLMTAAFAKVDRALDKRNLARFDAKVDEWAASNGPTAAQRSRTRVDERPGTGKELRERAQR